MRGDHGSIRQLQHFNWGAFDHIMLQRFAMFLQRRVIERHAHAHVLAIVVFYCTWYMVHA